MADRLKPEDLYRIKLLEDPQISPDGSRVAAVIAEIDRERYQYRRSIWLMDAGGEAEAKRFTWGVNDTSPRWSPDGRSLVFVRGPAPGAKPKTKDEHARGVGKPQLWLLSMEGGEARQLTQARDGAADPAWSPSGTSIAYVAEIGEPDDPEAADAQLEENRIPAVRTINRLWHRLDGKGWNYERRSHLFSISPDGGEPQALTDGDWDDTSPVFSPDGQRLAFTSDRTAERWMWPANDVWVLDLRSGQLTRLTDETVSAGPPAWSPDGRRIAFTAERRHNWDGYTDLFVVEVAAPGSAQPLTEDWAPTFGDSVIDDMRAGHTGPYLYWSPDGSEIYAQASGKGSTLLYAVPSRGGTPRIVIDGKQRIYAFSMDRERRRIAFASSDASTPGDLLVQDGDAPRARRVTQLNTELLATVELAQPEAFTFKGADGWEIEGWILRRPESGKRWPSILEIHGGPHGMYGWSFFFEFQLLASAGFAVLFTNPRGSTGYGRGFSNAVRNDWGGKDYLDLIAAVDGSIARGWIDAEQLGVAGGSYGGFMTNWIVGHTDRFKAAVTMRSISNLAAAFGTSDLGWYLSVEEMGGAMPWDRINWLIERSPVTYANQITTPLLILHSDNDLRCPIGEAEQLFTALKYLGREVKLVRFEGQSHDLSRSGHPRSRVLRLQHILDWFTSHIPVQAAAAAKPELARAGTAGE